MHYSRQIALLSGRLWWLSNALYLSYCGYIQYDLTCLKLNFDQFFLLRLWELLLRLINERQCHCVAWQWCSVYSECNLWHKKLILCAGWPYLRNYMCNQVERPGFSHDAYVRTLSSTTRTREGWEAVYGTYPFYDVKESEQTNYSLVRL